MKTNKSGTQEGSLISRRSFIQIAWQGTLTLSGLLGLGRLLRFLSSSGLEDSKNTFDLGKAEQYMHNAQTLIPEAHAMILNTDMGLRAMSMVCPHLGCQVKASRDGFTCPCHGSEFDSLGKRLTGRANTDLVELALDQTSSADLILYK